MDDACRECGKPIPAGPSALCDDCLADLRPTRGPPGRVASWSWVWPATMAVACLAASALGGSAAVRHPCPGPERGDLGHVACIGEGVLWAIVALVALGVAGWMGLSAWRAWGERAR